MHQLIVKHKNTIVDLYWRSIQIFSKQFSAFVIFIFAVKHLNIYDFGVYSYLFAIVYLLIVFSDFGISTSISKIVAEKNPNEDNKLDSERVFLNGLFVVGLISTLIFILFLFFGRTLFAADYLYLAIVLPLIFLIPSTSLYDGYLRGLKKFKESSKIVVSSSIISIIFSYILVTNYNLIGALFSQTLSYFILFFIYLLKNKLTRFNINKKIIKKIVGYSLIIGIANLGLFFFSKINIILLKNFNLIEEISAYELSQKLINIVYLPLLVFSQIISPRITTFFYSKNISLVLKKFKKYFTYVLLISVLISLFFISLSDSIIYMFFKEYLDTKAIFVLKLSFVFFPINSLSYLTANSFSIYTGHAYLNTKYLLFFGLLNLLISYFVLKHSTFDLFFVVFLVIQSTSNVLFILEYFYKLKKLEILRINEK